MGAPTLPAAAIAASTLLLRLVGPAIVYLFQGQSYVACWQQGDGSERCDLAATASFDDGTGAPVADLSYRVLACAALPAPFTPLDPLLMTSTSRSSSSILGVVNPIFATAGLGACDLGSRLTSSAPGDYLITYSVQADSGATASITRELRVRPPCPVWQKGQLMPGVEVVWAFRSCLAAGSATLLPLAGTRDSLQLGGGAEPLFSLTKPVISLKGASLVEVPQVRGGAGQLG